MKKSRYAGFNWLKGLRFEAIAVVADGVIMVRSSSQVTIIYLFVFLKRSGIPEKEITVF